MGDSVKSLAEFKVDIFTALPSSTQPVMPSNIVTLDVIWSDRPMKAERCKCMFTNSVCTY